MIVADQILQVGSGESSAYFFTGNAFYTGDESYLG